MYSTADHRSAGDGAGQSGDPGPSTEQLIELLGDDYARKILAALQDEAKSARALSEECKTSRPTVYRRLERLQKTGLVSERMEYDADGHHRRIFSLATKTVGFELGTDGFEAEFGDTAN